MAKTTAPSHTMQSDMYLVITFFVLMLVNAVVIFLGNALHPQSVVLGNMSLSPLWAIILSSGVLSLIVTFVWPFITEVSVRTKHVWSSAEMMGMYLVFNFVGLYLITRASNIFGLGVSWWMVVLLLAVVLDFLQGGVMMMIEKMKK